MSDAADKRTDETVSLDKKADGGPAADVRPGRPGKAPRIKQPAPTVPLPKTIQWASLAIIGQVVFTMAHALAARGFTPQLTQLMLKSNNDAKKPDKNFDALKHLADYRKGLLFQGVILSLAFIFLAISLRRSRGASGARWGFLIISVLVAQTNGPLTLLPIADYPGALTGLRALMGACSLAALVLIFLPPSLKYFRECKAANRPEGAPVRGGLGAMFGGGARAGAGAGARGTGGGARGTGGGARGPGGSGAGAPRGAGLLGSLFAPRPAPADRAAASRTETANPPRPKSKAKVRAEADAVAKGAELARTRAKASKSRRTETS